MSRRAEQMRAMVAEYEASGLPRRAFCAEHGLAVTTLDYWRRELANRPQLVPVRVIDDHPSYALVLANGRRIECASEGLASLIRAAEQA